MIGAGLVWTVSALLLAVLGARAWVVETGRGRPGRTPVRVLTSGAGVVLAVLVVALALNGGWELVHMLLNHSAATAAGGAAVPGVPPAAP